MSGDSNKSTIDQIAELGEKLYYSKIFSKCPIWINTQAKRKANPQAILYTLEQCLKEKPKEPWAWCEIVIKKANPKANAREFENKAHQDKNVFNELVEALKKFMGNRG